MSKIPEITETVDIDLDLLPPQPASITYSTTPYVDAQDLEKAPTGLVKDGRGYVPRAADLDPIFKKFADSLCSSEELKEALAVIGTDRATKFLYELIHQERKHGPGSGTIVRAAKKCGIGIDGLAQLWREHSTALAMTKLIAATPRLADDLVEASQNHDVLCPACQGEGVLEMRLGLKDLIECPQCHGQRFIRKAGDKDAREHALEWAGAINQPNKGGGGVGSNTTYVNLVLPRK